jgi:hypothetical protein
MEISSMDWPDKVSLTRALLLLYATLQLTFAWWYFGTWFWLPKGSLKRLVGWAFLFASVLALPLKVWPEVAHGIHRDEISQTIIFAAGIALIATMFYRIKSKMPSGK